MFKNVLRIFRPGERSMKPSIVLFGARSPCVTAAGVTLVKLLLPPAPRPWPQGFKELLREFLEQWKFKLPGKVNMSL